MSESKNEFIPAYQTAIRSMRDGRFDAPIPIDDSDEIGKLGQDLFELAQDLERKFVETIKMRKISEQITSGLFLDDVLNRIYTSFREVIPYSRMGCALLQSENTVAVAIWGKTDSTKLKLKNGFKAAMAESSLQEIIETGQPRILNDLEAYLAEHPASASTKLVVKEGMRSSLTCPLVANGNPVGFLFFSSMEKDTYSDVHQGIFLQIAAQISILIEKSQLYQQLYEVNQKLFLAQQELQERATHDFLTGIYNRGAIVGHLDAQLARSKRHKQPLCSILLDIDHFKHFNDNYGHLAGDAVLKSVAACIEECLREYDYVGRYGGEEFLVVLGVADADSAVKIAKRIIKSVEGRTVSFQDNVLAVTINAGVVIAERCADLTTDDIVSATDKELYKAKSNGRNQIEVCRL